MTTTCTKEAEEELENASVRALPSYPRHRDRYVTK